jgi:hypothetical protein
MATRTEDRFGETTALGTTYTNIGTVPSSTTWNILLNVTNRTTSPVLLRAYIADTSWASGEPTGGTLKAAIAYDLSISAGEVLQITGIILKTTEKLIVRSNTASSLDITANGVAIT